LSETTVSVIHKRVQVFPRDYTLQAAVKGADHQKMPHVMQSKKLHSFTQQRVLVQLNWLNNHVRPQIKQFVWPASHQHLKHWFHIWLWWQNVV